MSHSRVRRNSCASHGWSINSSCVVFLFPRDNESLLRAHPHWGDSEYHCFTFNLVIRQNFRRSHQPSDNRFLRYQEIDASEVTCPIHRSSTDCIRCRGSPARLSLRLNQFAHTLWLYHVKGR